MLSIIILRTEDFTNDTLDIIEETIVNLIENGNVLMVRGGGDSKNTIYNLFIKISI